MTRFAVLALIGCHAAPPPIASCDDALGGTYESPAGTWALIDTAGTREAYPLFVDAANAAPGVVAAPRVIDLRGTRGTVARRYMRGTIACTAKAPATLVRCAGTTLELVIGDPVEPVITTDCAYRSATTHRETWTRR